VKKEEVEATDNSMASVQKLSQWLSDDPFQRKKQITIRKSEQVAHKSRAFESDEILKTLVGGSNKKETRVEREKEHLSDLHKLMSEMDTLKKREKDNQNFLDMETRKLELEEQRVSHMLKNAETKLKFAEAKEKEIREHLSAEYDRVRIRAKQTYDDASDTVKKQMEFYAIEMERASGKLITTFLPRMHV
jgi:hypothetical protein